MGAAGGEGNQLIPRGDPTAIDNGLFFDYTDTEAGQIVIIALVHAGHLGGLSAYQGAACELAASANTCHDACSNLNIELARRVIVEEQ